MNKKVLDIYVMGIGGTAMGAFAGLLKEVGHHVRGSDSKVYSPMKESLSMWKIEYKTPYDIKNLKPNPDLVIIGNVIKKDNVEALEVNNENIPFMSFPKALKQLFLEEAIPLVATGTHGKTTCSALLAHTLVYSGFNPGYLIGGIPLNYEQSFRAPKGEKAPFVIEGDEYDTAFFDKGPKFMHYAPKYLLSTSLEFDHADIYFDVDAIIEAFARLYAQMENEQLIIVNYLDQNIKKALRKSNTKAKVLSYGDGGDYVAREKDHSSLGQSFNVIFKEKDLGRLNIPLFGEHNLSNALGCYALLHGFGLDHEQIKSGFKTFLGVKRRLQELKSHNETIIVDDFAHHPTAVKETIKAARQKYFNKKICILFEPRSATSCKNIFESDYIKAFSLADEVFLAPLGRVIEQGLDTKKIAEALNQIQVMAHAYDDYQKMFLDLKNNTHPCVFILMSNGDFGGQKENLVEILGNKESGLFLCKNSC